MPGSRWAPWLVSEWEGPARQGELTPSDSDSAWSRAVGPQQIPLLRGGRAPRERPRRQARVPVLLPTCYVTSGRSPALSRGTQR